MRNRWDDWMSNGIAEYTKSGKRRRASYEMVCEWVHDEWKKIDYETILKGFRENGYINYHSFGGPKSNRNNPNRRK